MLHTGSYLFHGILYRIMLISEDWVYSRKNPHLPAGWAHSTKLFGYHITVLICKLMISTHTPLCKDNYELTHNASLRGYANSIHLLWVLKKLIKWIKGGKLGLFETVSPDAPWVWHWLSKEERIFLVKTVYLVTK